MPLSARLEWWTGADAATAGSFVGDWKICAADPGAPDTFRVHASSAQPDRLHAATHPPGASGDPDTLWRHATGPARVETLLADVAVAVTDIDMAGDLRTRTLVDATPALLALHADVVDAVLTRRATGVARALAEFPDAALMPAIDAWFTARLAEVDR